MASKEDPAAQSALLEALLHQPGGRGTAAGRGPGDAGRTVRRLAIAAVVLVLGWFFVAEPLLEPLTWKLAEARRTSRVAGHRDAIRAAAEGAGLDPYLVAGMVYAESSGRIDARSSANAMGLMQLMLPTAREQARKLGLAEPDASELLTDPALNLTLGAHYFAWLLGREEGDPVRALVAYNAGPARLRGWLEEAGGYAEWLAERREAGDSQVLAYADKVLAAAERFRDGGLFAEAPPAVPNPSPDDTP